MSSNWVTIYSFNLPHEAYVIKGRLENEGIICNLKDESTVQVYHFYSNALHGVKVQVMEPDVQEAIEIMKEGGYHFEEQEHTSNALKWLGILAAKIPGIHTANFLKKLLITTLSIVALIAAFTIYTRNKNAAVLNLTEGIWTIDFIKVNDTLLLKPRHTVSNDLFNREIYNLVPNVYGELVFNEQGIINANFYWENNEQANWIYSDRRLTINNFREKSAILNGDYQMTVSEDDLYIASKGVKMKCHHNL